jgi:hypothetical protein
MLDALVKIDVEGALEEVVGVTLMVLAVPFVIVFGALWLRRHRD